MQNTPTKAAPDLNSFPKLVRDHNRQRPNKIAMREKDFGIWQSYKWREVWENMRLIAYGLRSLGLKAEQPILIIGDNRPQLYWAMMGAQALRAVPIPIYQDALPEDIISVVENSNAACVIAENQEYVDKMLQVAERVESLKTVIYKDDRGMRDYKRKTAGWALHSWEELLAKGEELGAKEPNFLDNSIDEGSPEDVAIIPYTSGTTGKPKGVVLTQRNVLETAIYANEFDELTEKDDIISYLPIAWIGDFIFSYAQSIAAGFTVNFPESQETLLIDMRDIGPSFFFAPPRVMENLLTNVMIRMQDAHIIKRKLFDWFIKFAETTGERLLNKEKLSLSERLVYGIGNLLIYAPLKDALGLSRVRVAYTAGEAIGPEIFRFYRALGINLKQLYGQTEASVCIAQQPNGEVFSDTVGPPCPWVEVKIDESGELMFRSVGVFREYYRNPKGTRTTKTADGWVYSGDAATILKNGHIKIIDRAKDVGHLNKGALLAPKYIENKLKFYPDIKEAVVFGDKRDFVTAFINIDLQSMGAWAERNAIVYASYQELAAHPQVLQTVAAHVAEVNKSLKKDDMGDCRIQRFCILPKELDADDGELTRTRKVRRATVNERYKPLIDALYKGDKACDLAVDITFEDGRRGQINGHIEIRDM